MSDPFDGTWTIDLEASTVWDDVRKCHVRDEVGQEIITLRTVDGVQDYEVLYGDRPRIRMGYTARIDAPEWVPYAVREIIAQSGDVQAEVAAFKERIHAADGERERDFVVGKAYALVRIIHVDEMTHYRVSRNPRDGLAHSIMLRRMAPDRQSYVATVLDVNGVVFRVRRFVRVQVAPSVAQVQRSSGYTA